MNDRALRIALAGLSLAGLAVTGYLLSVRWGGATLYCTTSGCETVQNSSYAVLLGVPVAAAGFLSYLALGASALTTHPLALAGAALFGLAAVAFSAYLSSYASGRSPGLTQSLRAARPRVRSGRARPGSPAGASA